MKNILHSVQWKCFFMPLAVIGPRLQSVYRWINSQLECVSWWTCTINRPVNWCLFFPSPLYKCRKCDCCSNLSSPPSKCLCYFHCIMYISWVRSANVKVSYFHCMLNIILLWSSVVDVLESKMLSLYLSMCVCLLLSHTQDKHDLSSCNVQLQGW